MALHQTLAKYLDGLDASLDGRGFNAKHEKARLFVEGACKLVSIPSRMDTPTGGVEDEEKAEDIMAELDDATWDRDQVMRVCGALSKTFFDTPRYATRHSPSDIYLAKHRPRRFKVVKVCRGKLMVRIRRTVLGILALVTSNAVIDGKAAWAEGIPRLDARVIAINIPGASAVSQVGTFISGPATPFGQCTLPHPIPAFSSGDFIKTGAVLDPKRILVGSRSNFGAPLAIGVGQEGSFLSIDPSAPRTLNVPPNFAQSGVQASALGGAVQMYSANSPHWSNGVNNFGANTASYTGVSDPLGLSNNNAFGRLWPSNAPFGESGIGSSSVLDPDGLPLKGAPSSVIGGVYVGDLTNRDKVEMPKHQQVIPGSLSKGAVGTALLGPSPDGTCRAVFAVVTADGAIVQEHTQKGLDGIAPKGTIKPLLGRSWDSPHQHVEPRLGVLMNPYTGKQSAEQLFVSEPFNNTIAVVNLVFSGTAPDQVYGLRPPMSSSVRRISSSSLKLPVDLAPVKRDADSTTWASNTTLDEDSDFFVANRGDNTIVRMRQDGTVVGIRRVTVDSIPLNNFAINGIATSVDGSKIYVTFTTPTKLEGGLLEVPAFGGCSLHSMGRFMPQSRHADKRNRCHLRG